MPCEVWVPVRTLLLVRGSIKDGRSSEMDKRNIVMASSFHFTVHRIQKRNQAQGRPHSRYRVGSIALGHIDPDIFNQAGIKYALIFEEVQSISVTAP